MDSKKGRWLGRENLLQHGISVLWPAGYLCILYSDNLKCRIIYVFNGPELTLGALRIFHHPGNEMADAGIKNDCLSRNLCRQFTLPASDQHSGPT